MKRHSGFTAVELILGLGIFALVSVALSALASTYVAYGRLLPEGRLSSEVARTHHGSLEELKRSIRQAESILTDYAVGSDTYVTATTSIALRLYARDAAGNVNTNAFDYAVYYLATSTSPQELRKRLVADVSSSRKAAHFALNPLVSGLSFSYNNATTSQATKVTIDLTSQKTSGTLIKTLHNVIDVTLR